MNHYKYICIQIQDLSTGEFVPTVTEENFYADFFELSAGPMTYTVRSDDFDSLLQAKEIMTASLDSIYLVNGETKEVFTDSDGYESYVVKHVPAYLDNLVYYNICLADASADWIKYRVKKLNKNRFQLVETFTNKKPEPIPLCSTCY